MDATMGSAPNNTNNFEPFSDVIDEEDCNTILIYLPGFRKDELKVQLKGSKVVKISGMRAIGQNKWSSFQKEFPVSENCDTNKISAKFEDGILYIRLPKLIVPAEKDATPPPPPEHHPTPTTPTSRVDEKPVIKNDEEIKERKPVIKNDEEIKERKPVIKDEEERGGAEIEKKEEEEEERNDVVRDRKGHEGGGDDDHYKMVMNAAGKLKMAREKMSNILLFLFAFALGFYISNLSCFSTHSDNSNPLP